MIREGILDSEKINQLSFEAEVFYRRLMSVVDDFGRYDGRSPMIRANCYPLKLHAVNDIDIDKWMTECISAGLIMRYSVDGKPYILIHNFDQRMRMKKSKYPDPPTDDSTCPQSADTCQQTAVICPPEVEVEKEIEYEDEEEARASASPTSSPEKNKLLEAEAENKKNLAREFSLRRSQPVESLAEQYLADRRICESVCMDYSMDHATLCEWMGNFVAHKIRGADPEDSYQNFARHFRAWLTKVDLDAGPQSWKNQLSNGKSESYKNGQSKSPNGAQRLSAKLGEILEGEYQKL